MTTIFLIVICLISVLYYYITSGSKYYDAEIMTIMKTFNNEKGVYRYEVYVKDSYRTICESFTDEQGIDFEFLLKGKSIFNIMQNIEYRKNMKKLCGIMKYHLDKE